MPPKTPPYEYYDANRPPSLEDEALARVLGHVIRRGWNFLPESQLDENFAEWRAAAFAPNYTTTELKAAAEKTKNLRLTHACNADALADLARSGELTSHRYRIDHPHEYPKLQRRPGYPTKTESALKLDDYVHFSFEGYSLFADRLDRGVITVFAIDTLLQKQGIVFPFDSMASLGNTPFHERPMILQALALRTSDYAKLLPYNVAATQKGEPGAVQPQWFTNRFGEKSYQTAEIKLAGNVYIGDKVINVTGPAITAL